jgi:hypothetical protein
MRAEWRQAVARSAQGIALDVESDRLRRGSIQQWIDAKNLDLQSVLRSFRELNEN